MGKYDLLLRTFSQNFPKEFVKGFLPPNTEFTLVGWTDTQLTTKERRMDKAIKILVDDKEALLHVEFQTEPDSDMDHRVFEYHNLLALAECGIYHNKPPPIKSIVILLTGTKDPGPLSREYKTSWEGEPFCGVRYDVVPVYLMSIEELEAKQSLLWLVFAPLTIDAEEDKIKELLKRIEEHVDNKQTLHCAI